jgi:hypothetical protein
VARFPLRAPIEAHSCSDVDSEEQETIPDANTHRGAAEVAPCLWQKRRSPSERARLPACYLPRDVFFGRLGFAGAFFSVWASDLGRFFPATSGSFPAVLLRSAP